MKRIFAASAAAMMALALGGATWASCMEACSAACTGWYGDDPAGFAACMNGCAFGCNQNQQ